MASLPRRPHPLRPWSPVSGWGALRSLWSAPAIGRPVEAHEVRTARLLLRPYRVSDEADWRRIEDDEEVRLGLDWPLRTARQVREHLVDRTAHTTLSRPGDLLVLAMELDGHVIGDVSLHLRTVALETRVAEIGWLQLTAAGGHGYATEAARAMLDLAFDELGACLVTAVVARSNIASARLALRLGFRPAGGTADHATFVIAASEHRPARPVRGASEASPPRPESVEKL
ncbi:GNAT family N-acetyltransferase [Leifsonia sp. Leaf336]|uniref:GNAT family N-acetyltransferase n=1 Tax=Leifsonia sp. Leaf336 TaxID=1736341 RepID=UPI0009E8CA7F|nr:GNAT family N-acetyltransferase [Leifsonia sp. Leaf336]